MAKIDTEYVPYGEEWKKEMMKFTKPELINLLKRAYIAKVELERELIR